MSSQAHVAGPKTSDMAELTMRGFVLGALITVVFTSSNVYLGLKVGLTFSSSIPAAVISMAVLSFFSRSNILENNMVQTQASAAGTLSAVIFILPAMLMVGYWSEFYFWQTMLICMAGGAMGVIFSIPLRRTMVVNSTLPYPEGVAAAEILIAGHKENDDAQGEGGAKDILFGGIVSAIVCFFTSGLHLLADKAGFWFSTGRAIFQIPFGFSLALMSAGYLMGLTAGIAMLIGVFFSWGIFVPALTAQLGDSGAGLMETGMRIWSGKVRFIGAGTIAIAAVWTLITLIKPMIEGIKLSISAISGSAHGAVIERTDRDLSMKSLIVISAALALVLVAVFHSFVRVAPFSGLQAWGLVLFAVVMVFVIGFFIAAACGYMAGLVGSSNSPISGIGIIALIAVSSLLILVDSTLSLFGSPELKLFGMALAIFITSGVVCVAAISNDNLQDLKTGYLVRATPGNQQIALLVGCVVGAAVIAPVLGLLYQAYGFAGAPLPRPGMDTSALLSAPQATLMMTIVQGIFARSLDWNMLLLGVGTGITVIATDVVLGRMGAKFRISALAVGLGIYLPPSISMAIIVGSLLNFAVSRRLAAKSANTGSEHNKKGVLIASGFIVGESLMGVLLAIAVLVSLSMGFGDAPFSLTTVLTGLFGDHTELIVTELGAAVFIVICLIFYRKSIR